MNGNGKVVTVKKRESPGERIFMPILGLWVVVAMIYALGWWALVLLVIAVVVLAAVKS